MFNFLFFDIWGHTENNSFPWLLQNKSEVSTLAGTKFFMLMADGQLLIFVSWN